MNRLIVIVLLVELGLVLASAILGVIWQVCTSGLHLLWLCSFSSSFFLTHCCVLLTDVVEQETEGKGMWYLDLGHNLLLQLIEYMFTFLVLYSPMVPISLYVTLEFVRILQAGFIEADITMFHEDTNTPALARFSLPPHCLATMRYSQALSSLSKDKQPQRGAGPDRLCLL